MIEFFMGCNIFQQVFFVFVALFYMAFFGLFRWSRTYRKLACWIGWHSAPSFDSTDFDGCSVEAKCKWCGYEGLIDSQGNLF